MKPRILTWNGVNIQDGTTFNSYIPPGQMANLSSNVVMVNRVNDFPFLSTNAQVGHTFTINVIVAPSYDINTGRELVKKYFNVSDLQRHNLVVQDEANNNVQYYLTGFPIRIITESETRFNSFFVTFQVEYPYWRQVTASVDSWDITATADSDIVNNSGNINSKPIFAITANTTKTAGYKYWRYITLYNAMDKSFAAPVEITNGGLDIQTLIDAGKMQANGNDFRVWQDGAFSDRWLYEMDSDSDPALCWTNETLSSRNEVVTLSTFDSDDTTIYFTQTKASLSFLRNLKQFSNKFLLVESEIIGYSDSDIDTILYLVNNVTRSQKYTTAVSHAASTTVRQLEHDLWILYGDSDATAPDVDNDFKPIFDLSSSNLLWTYTNFFDSTANRPGAWKGEILSTKTNLSFLFTDSDPTVVTNPSLELGIAMVGGGDFQIANEAGTIDWMNSHPSGIKSVTYSGFVYNTSSWPSIVGLQYLIPNTVWTTAQNETEPTNTFAWEAFGPHVTSLGGTYESIRFAIDGQLDSVINERAMAKFDGVTLSFDSDNLPVISMGDENTINFFDFKLTNNTTGEYIKVTCPCPVGTVLTIDCESKRAYLADGTKVNVILSSERDGWLDLISGNNSLQYDDIGTVSVHINITHRDRIL